MVSISNIPLECEKIIIGYLGNCISNNDLYLVNKNYKEHFSKCQVKRFGSIVGCQCHSHNNYGAIITLETVPKKRIKKKTVASIHFDNSTQREIALPEAAKFGEISHYCCHRKGIMYKNKNLHSGLFNRWCIV